MASLLDPLFGAGDADVSARIVGTWDGDLGGRLQLQLLQLLTVLTNDKSMVFLGDGNGSGCLVNCQADSGLNFHCYIMTTGGKTLTRPH